MGDRLMAMDCEWTAIPMQQHHERAGSCSGCLNCSILSALLQSLLLLCHKDLIARRNHGAVTRIHGTEQQLPCAIAILGHAKACGTIRLSPHARTTCRSSFRG